MDRRKIYKIVAELLPRMGGTTALLNAVADAMRMRLGGRGSATSNFPADLEPLLNQDDALGQIYQAINAPALEAAYRATSRTGRKFTADEIPSVTQLFTPKWVVEFLLQNTLGLLWLEIHPDTRLKRTWKWLATLPPRPVLRERAGARAGVRAIDLRICDPACGTMNFGLVALDMLREMYLEEISRAGQPDWADATLLTDADEIDASILRHNLIGCDIDPTAIDLGRRSLEIKIGKPIREHQLFVRDALFDKRFRGEFDVVVTNPPYLSARNLDPAVVRRLKARYPSAWRDLYACFMLRSLEMLRPGGRVGILSMHSFMFTAAFERMRCELLQSADIQTVAHFGPGLFDIGNPGTLQTAAVVLQRRSLRRNPAVFFRLTEQGDKRASLAKAIGGDGSARFEVSQQQIASLPRSAWMYWISPACRRVFREFSKLGEIAPPRQGLATTDNMRFVRYWWEVEPPNFSGPRDKWMPYAKGGRFRRWYESPRHRVNWEDDGREIKSAIVQRYPYLDGQWQWVAKNSVCYGREGITYSYLTSGAFSARRLEPGTIFDVAGSSLFPDDLQATLGVLNSSVARQLLSAINPTVNFQVGDLRQLPMPRSFPNELREQVGRAIEWTRQLDCFDETSPDFVQPEPWNCLPAPADELRTSIAGAEQSVDGIVAELYGLAAEDQGTEARTHEGTKEELARRWISYALGVWLGRWGQSAAGDIAVLSPLDQKLCRDLRRTLAERAGENAGAEIQASAGGMDRFLAREFLPWHNRLYRCRPVYWGFGGGGRTVAVLSLRADPRLMRTALRMIGQSLPVGWRRWLDDGTAINLARLAPWIADRKLQTFLMELAAELELGRFNFSQTGKCLMRALSRGSSVECAPARRRFRAAARNPAGRRIPLPR
jgi:hypothetical protein